ncbi:hypothetical protein H696_00077 [Fonticula alba]|uniref:YbgI/family dinuclear metal center protein n=1 Tax=Fonticula alba TaxID=691883 RepID=A0A058ZG94_FONAL|nr:hypothetical protein H696_00077 [Fonticula alba]KCV72482.1 hypothetical protein H696_00077 [Fonticula alba]|eukprot:XP_009492183.1 hypothetical protein H696_00077 [Fonticula alba]
MSTLAKPSLLKRVVSILERHAPLAFAGSWDNVGLIIEAPHETLDFLPPRPVSANATHECILLTNDLTLPVVREAAALGASVIVAYHPALFGKTRRLTTQDDRQRIALTCAALGISVYCPHTAWDSCEGGINDWLASIVGRASSQPTSVRPISQFTGAAAAAALEAGQPNAGEGRIVTFAEPVALSSIADALKAGLKLEYLRCVLPDQATPVAAGQQTVSQLAICAGSGASVLAAAGPGVDGWLTGEMGHHEALSAAARGVSVLLCEHSNSERGYLTDVMQPLLKEKLQSDQVSVVVSQVDRDPIQLL